MRRTVAILVFDDVEVLDFTGPFEVFAVTDELRGHSAYHVVTVSAGEKPVRARNGLRVVADHTWTDCPRADVLIIPGGFGTRALLARPELLEWVRSRSQETEVLMSVCTGSLVLAKAGLLDGLRVTTHHERLDLLRELAPTAEVVANERFIDHGRLLTAAGISAGIDCSLHVVKRHCGNEAAAATARYMEYRWP